MLHFRFVAISSLLISFCTCSKGTHAQPYYFRHYQVENGLSNSTVFCSTQDQKGFLWFGTKEGLNRFDGYHFKLFTPNDNKSLYLNSDLIYCLFSDQDGTLWVGGQNGLFRFDEQQEKLIRVIDSLVEINWIQRDDMGNLWFLCLNNVYRYNLSTKRLTHFPENKYFFATSICKSEDGGIWFTTSDGLIKKFDDRTETFLSYNVFAHSREPSSRWLQRIRYAGHHIFLIGTSNQGLKTFDESTGDYQDILTYNPDKTAIFVRDILQYGPDEFWLGTESGIFILNMKTRAVTNLRKKFLDPYSLSDNAIYTLCKDSEGGVWAGTYFGGVNYYSRQHSSFQKYFPDNSSTSISGSAVREICQDHYNNIWIGTEDAGLNKLNPRTGVITHFLPGGSATDIDYTNIHGLIVTGNDLWIGTFEHGLDVMDIRTGKVKRRYLAGPHPNELKSNFVLCFAHTMAGELLMGSSNGAYAYREKTNDFSPLPGIPIHLFVAAITEDHDGTVWIGTHGSGVYYYNPLTGRNGHLEGSTDGNHNGATINVLNAITEDSQHNIWFSTEGSGVYRLSPDRKTFTNYTTASGLPSNFIFKVVEDNNNDVWISTSRGLASLRGGSVPFEVYTRANGLLNDQFNYSSGFKDREGKLYFGSVRGMITFSPNDVVPSGFKHAVYITGFQVDNKELTISKDSSILKKSIIYTDQITLPYDQSSFSIDFTALSYTSPERTQYSYKMEGLDKGWTDIKTNRKVYYTNLSPGKYLFNVEATTGNSRDNNKRQLAIEVLPPFWETKMAYFIYTLLTGLLIYYIVRNYHRRTEIKKEKEIYEAKFDFFTNIAHEIRTPLTLIKGPAENLREKIDEIPAIKEDVVMLERNTNRLIALVTQILDFRQTETKGFSLDFTWVNITGVLQETYLNFSALTKKKNITYLFEHPPTDLYVLADEEALNKIFSNLFSNAVKYGQNYVCVRLIQSGEEEGDILIEISNDGPLIPPEMRERIFEPFYRLKGNGKQKGTGIGLALARSLTELHKGRVYVKDGLPGLNTFICILPVSPERASGGKRFLIPRSHREK
ncbi:MAG TPA: two-component regulator propeller domain-containing protein [Puia sp.]|nr:two-component regulator propeller domain-containing protein [Puia sp.]